MTPLAREEYEQKLARFIADEKAQAVRKPEGFFGNWAFYTNRKRAFDRELAEAGFTAEPHRSS